MLHDLSKFTIRQIRVVKTVEEGVSAIALPTLTRPPVPFDRPNEDLELFALRVYAYSLIAHIRTILAGVVSLEEADNFPSARLLCRHMFEWTAQAAYVAENVSKHINGARWPDVFNIVSNFDRANDWIKKYGEQHGAHPIQLDSPDRVRLKHWIAAYDKFRVEKYGAANVTESYDISANMLIPAALVSLATERFAGLNFGSCQLGKQT